MGVGAEEVVSLECTSQENVWQSSKQAGMNSEYPEKPESNSDLGK